VTGNVTGKNLIAQNNVIVGGNVILLNDPIKLNSTKVVFGNTLNIIPTNSKTIILWDKTEYGTNWDGATKIPIKRTGVYHLNATMDWEGSPFGERNIFTLINGNIAGSADTKSMYNYPGNLIQSCSCDIALKQGDNVQLMVEQTSLSNIVVNVYGLSNMSVRYVHDVSAGVNPLVAQPIVLSKVTEEHNTAEIKKLRVELEEMRKTLTSFNKPQNKIYKRPKFLSSVNRMM
jgi:hypothetical protein